MAETQDRFSREQLLGFSPNALRTLEYNDLIYEAQPMAAAVVRHIFEQMDALWLHSGEPKAPHAELTSGKCSNGFVDVLRVLRYTNLCHIFGHELSKLLRQNYIGAVDWVIGSDHAGAALSHSVALWLKAMNDFTEKGENKTHSWNRFTIEPGEVVLQVEELVTTTGTLEAVRRGVRQGNSCPVTFVPAALTLIHRSHVYEIEETPILYLAHFDIQTWTPAECPLCAVGSERIRPKQKWAKLTGL